MANSNKRIFKQFGLDDKFYNADLPIYLMDGSKFNKKMAKCQTGKMDTLTILQSMSRGELSIYELDRLFSLGNDKKERM